MLYGILNLSFWGYVIAILALTQLTVASVTIYLHRCQAHRALHLHPIASHFFRFWLWLTTGMRTKDWVSIHRKHHAKCETPEDPHSPVILGIKKVFFQGAELYRAAAKVQETKDRYGEGTPDDWIERHLYTPHSGLGLRILFVLNLVLFGVPGITVWAIQMLWIPIFAAGVINGIGHYWGYRNFECPDAARNIVPVTFFACGEELHNNHHTFPTSAKLSVKWWEFDIGWGYIRVLQSLGLAKVKRIPTKLERATPKIHLDVETLKTILANRFQVMAHYAREVILPVLKDERARAGEAGRDLFKRAKVLLTRSDNLLDESSKLRIAEVLKKSQELHLVYHYRTRLQAIWSRTTASQKELLEALQTWCKEAETTGINTLRHFANRLRSYAVSGAAST